MQTESKSRYTTFRSTYSAVSPSWSHDLSLVYVRCEILSHHVGLSLLCVQTFMLPTNAGPASPKCKLKNLLTMQIHTYVVTYIHTCMQYNAFNQKAGVDHGGEHIMLCVCVCVSRCIDTHTYTCTTHTHTCILSNCTAFVRTTCTKLNVHIHTSTCLPFSIQSKTLHQGIDGWCSTITTK